MHIGRRRQPRSLLRSQRQLRLPRPALRWALASECVRFPLEALQMAETRVVALR